MQQRSISLSRLFLLSAGVVSAACGSSSNDISGKNGALEAHCAASADTAEVPAGAWLCPEARTVECTSGTGLAEVDALYVVSSDAQSCSGSDLAVSNAGPFAVGTHEVTVSDDEGEALCTAELTVTDTTAPELSTKTLQLWPPNHKFHSIAVSDCVTAVDSCNGSITGEFIWASSDEPVDDKGDGHHAPDIQLDDCGNVSLRAERAGPQNGRVYKLGVRVVDGAGNASEGVCNVIVDHDQRGVQGAHDGESYRVTFDGSDGTLACDGVTLPPVVTPPSDDGSEPPTDDGSEPPTDDGSEPPTDDGSEPPTDGDEPDVGAL